MTRFAFLTVWEDRTDLLRTWVPGVARAIAAWTTPGGMMAGTVLTAVGVAFSTPAFFSAIFATAKPSERGAAAGTASLFIDLGLGFGPFALGFVAQDATIPAALAAGAACAAAGAF